MTSRTLDFQTIVKERAALVPQKPNPKRREKHDEASYDLFTKEAYRIYQHIDSLRRFLITIRPAYLSTKNRGVRTRSSLDTSNLSGDSLFSLFSNNIHNLTDRERDEIDFQAKLIIRRCIDRIKELEESEKIRKANEASKPTNRFTQLLGFALLPSATEDVLFVHRSSITWLLNQQLMQVSQIQKDQQEIRLMREIEKSENQLSKSTFAEIPPPVVNQEILEFKDDDPFEQELTNEQVQMLEKENSVMLEDLNNTLNQVKSAEKALLEISTLQTQLANHLAAQTIQTDRLYADAVATTDRVEQGNLQLITARERNKSSRKFMLAFLIGASFVLLFLDWYS
ncbi:uncharacterized protein B0P05DRAFT_576076 [Gilbertella persicaria]|uniref:uncharacterized protein n=1 Tax=Gilbertella persicaria TaxID=101096 RepID=UPI0022205631|nr:uncharacterized protein B0P05DRAFT_576076 [Gilbertella persicaria]KAI8048153.1 hypothetical protein B0P05DRAFT_576076 [Gilbertella persicaria]